MHVLLKNQKLVQLGKPLISLTKTILTDVYLYSFMTLL